MRLLVVALVALVVAPSPLAAQAIPPAEVVPPSTAFGDGWMLATVDDGDTSQWPSFQRFTAAIYLGPNGSRILVGVIAADPGATDDAWMLANGMFDQYVGRFNPDLSNEGFLNSQALITDCAATRRMEGSDEVIPAIPSGMSLCEAGETIVLAYVSGELGGVSGAAASDRVIEVVLAG